MENDQVHVQIHVRSNIRDDGKCFHLHTVWALQSGHSPPVPSPLVPKKDLRVDGKLPILEKTTCYHFVGSCLGYKRTDRSATQLGHGGRMVHVELKR